jgi:hypothetical protein
VRGRRARPPHFGIGSPPWQYVQVPRALKLLGLAALFAAGLVAGAVIVGAGQAQDTTTTTTTTTLETTTTPGTTETVEHTTTRKIILPATTTGSESSDNGTPTWVWILLGVLALGVVVLLVVLLTRRGGGGVSAEERRRLLDGAVSTWVAQGWAVESQTADSAVLRRGGELMAVSVDQVGQVTTRPLSAGPPT